MKILFKYSAIVASLIVSSISFGQGTMNTDRATSQQTPKEYANETWRPSLVPDGMIDRVADKTNRTLAWYNVRENDIAFKRRFWKRIDVKEKQNMPFIFKGDEYSGGGAFIEILIDGVKRGKFRAFRDDAFTSVLTFDEIKAMLTTESSTPQIDPLTGEETFITVTNEFDPTTIATFEVQEDYIYDRNAGRLVARLRSITPKKASFDPVSGDFRGWQTLFTIYYPEARESLSQYEVYNPQNDVHRMSWTDYLDRMMYSGYVFKSSRNNPTGENIPGGLKGLIDGQKEMDMLIQKDIDMWEL